MLKRLNKNIKLINFIHFIGFVILSLIGLNGHAASQKIKELFQSQSSIENPMELRDPFLAPKFKSERIKKAKSKAQKGVYSNIPEIGDVKIDDIQIVGVVIGPNRRAFAQIGADKKIYTLKEGMKLGNQKATLRAILPGGIVLVEKNTNIYGEDEYLETVIPISK